MLSVLKCITFTGADDSVEPQALLNLSEKYPFIEWGILFSGTKQGGPRFPSRQWVERLATASKLRDSASRGGSAQFSAHLCGKWVRDFVLDLNPSWFDEYRAGVTWIFHRVQLNFHGEFHRAPAGFDKLVANWIFNFILQCDGVNDDTARYLASINLAVPLFDTSGGAGILPRAGWPEPWPNTYCGYAGGLGPYNIQAQLEVIARKNAGGSFWIDMERRVRSEDDQLFDLEKVEAVCELAQAVTL